MKASQFLKLPGGRTRASTDATAEPGQGACADLGAAASRAEVLWLDDFRVSAGCRVTGL